MHLQNDDDQFIKNADNTTKHSVVKRSTTTTSPNCNDKKLKEEMVEMVRMDHQVLEAEMVEMAGMDYLVLEEQLCSLGQKEKQEFLVLKEMRQVE